MYNGGCEKLSYDIVLCLLELCTDILLSGKSQQRVFLLLFMLKTEAL